MTIYRADRGAIRSQPYGAVGKPTPFIQAYSDNFNRANGPLGSAWLTGASAPLGFTNALDINANQCFAPIAGNNEAAFATPLAGTQVDFGCSFQIDPPGLSGTLFQLSFAVGAFADAELLITNTSTIHPGNWHFTMIAQGPGSSGSIVLADPVPGDVWKLAYDSVAGTFTFFVNGVQIFQQVGVTPAIVNPVADLLIRQGGAVDNFFAHGAAIAIL